MNIQWNRITPMCDWDEDDRMLKVADFEVENKKKLKNLEMERF